MGFTGFDGQHGSPIVHGCLGRPMVAGLDGLLGGRLISPLSVANGYLYDAHANAARRCKACAPGA